jgi:hypothetical protein
VGDAFHDILPGERAVGLFRTRIFADL